MNQPTREQVEFSRLTSTSLTDIAGLPKPGTTTPLGFVYYASFEAATFPQPNGCVSISEHIESQENDPLKLAALEQARNEVRELLYPERETIATLRLRKGWSQQRLAEAMETSQPQIARIESGRVDPQRSTILKLAESLECDVITVFKAVIKFIHIQILKS